jgi:hypothetical protein
LGAAILAVGVTVRFLARSTMQVHGYVRLTNDGLAKETRFPVSLATDGQQIFFTEVLANQSRLSRVSVNGGETISSPAPIQDAQVADALPARNELLIGSTWRTGDDQPMLINKMGTGTFQTLWSIRAHDGSWSPDGKKLAFAQGSSLFVASLTDGGSTKIATVPGIFTGHAGRRMAAFSVFPKISMVTRCVYGRSTPMDQACIHSSRTRGIAIRSVAVLGRGMAAPSSIFPCDRRAAKFAYCLSARESGISGHTRFSGFDRSLSIAGQAPPRARMASTSSRSASSCMGD